MTADVTAAVDAAFREEWGRVVATLIRVTGDWDLAEECAQDAFAMALRRWPADGIPGRRRKADAPGRYVQARARVFLAWNLTARKAPGCTRLG